MDAHEYCLKLMSCDSIIARLPLCLVSCLCPFMLGSFCFCPIFSNVPLSPLVSVILFLLCSMSRPCVSISSSCLSCSSLFSWFPTRYVKSKWPSSWIHVPPYCSNELSPTFYPFFGAFSCRCEWCTKASACDDDFFCVFESTHGCNGPSDLCDLLTSSPFNPFFF